MNWKEITNLSNLDFLDKIAPSKEELQKVMYPANFSLDLRVEKWETEGGGNKWGDTEG